MVSGSGIDRDRLTGGSRVSLAAVVLGVGAVALIAAGIWYFAFRGSEEPGAAPITTTTTPSTATTEGASTETTTPGSNTTEPGATETTLPREGEIGSIPVLTEAEAYNGEQSRLVWLPGSQSAWIVDMEAATVGMLPDVPPGPRGWGAPSRDGALIVDIAGRMYRRTPNGEWQDASPAADRSYRIVDTRTGEDHLHIYVIESGGVSNRLLNLMYRYDQPNVLEEKWVADATDIVRVSASKAMQLVILELTPAEAGAEPRYLLLSEQTGRPTSRSTFPRTEPGISYVWGVEFIAGPDVFYMQCEAASYSGCALSDGFVVNLSSGATAPVGDLYPGWSREWETPTGIPSFTNSYREGSLLVRTNVDIAGLQTGNRDRLISAREY